MFEINEDPILSKPVTLDLQDYFRYTIVNINERSLSTIWKIQDMKRMHWNTKGEDRDEVNMNQHTGSTIVINPMQIRTFFIDFL
jgi:hypothetical protein